MENIKFPIEDIKIHVKGDLAWVTYSYRMSGKYKGSLLLTAGAATMVLEKRGGAWLIVHEHTSTKRRPPAAPAAKPEQK
jgi:ketosteroid isomerase-like protein